MVTLSIKKGKTKFTQSGVHLSRDAMIPDEYNQTTYATQDTSLNQPQLLLSSCPKDRGVECKFKLAFIATPITLRASKPTLNITSQLP